MNKLGFYLHILLLLLFNNVAAQVTIGSDIEPRKGALLDLKESNLENNSSKGILFPRVVLSNEKELYPMFGTVGNEDPEYTANKNTSNTIKSEHKGLIVYNLSEEGDFSEGLYIWDGFEWKAFQNKIVLPPAIDELLCEQVKLSPTKYNMNEPYNGILTIPYVGGNGMNYKKKSITIDGLTIELIPGTLNSGQGILYYKVSGTPTAEIIDAQINFANKNCIVHLESENDMEIKTMEYVRNRIEVSNNGEKNKEISLTTLGNLQVRYYGGDSGLGYIEFRTIEKSHVTYQYTKHGEGGNFLGRYNQIASNGTWLDLGYGTLNNTTVSNITKDINLSHRDVTITTFILHNTKEVYRLTVNANAYIRPDNGVPEVPARVSFFLEKLE